MYQQEGRFHLPAAHKPAALAAIKAWARDFYDRDGYRHGIDYWCRHDTLEDTLTENRWTTETDNCGNIIDLQFEGEKLWDDYEMMRAIAPWVVDGSYLWMVGEDGTQWKWVFRDGECLEFMGTVVFEEDK